MDRPFAIGSATLDNNFDGCNCIYSKKECIYIKCESCCNPLCKHCGDTIGTFYTDLVKQRICRKCDDKIKFRDKWKNATINEKLSFYGMDKLKKLGKQKKIVGISKLKKTELIMLLSDVATNNDFPIK